MLDIILVHHQLETVQDRVNADLSFYREPGFFFKFFQQGCFVVAMKGIHDLIGKAHKSVQVVHGNPQIPVQQPDGAVE